MQAERHVLDHVVVMSVDEAVESVGPVLRGELHQAFEGGATQASDHRTGERREGQEDLDVLRRVSLLPRTAVYTVALFSILALGSFGGHEFIYFQF